jgi:hypothetical protein
VKTVKRKVLVIAVALMAVAMLALPISVVSATKPTTMTLSGKIYVLGTGSIFPAGESGNVLLKFRDVPVLWTGDIAGSGVYNGNWLDKGGDLVLDVGVGTHVLEDVTIDGVGTGDLTIGQNHVWNYFIKSGSGDLSSIRGKGTITMVNPVTYDYELEIQINP